MTVTSSPERTVAGATDIELADRLGLSLMKMMRLAGTVAAHASKSKAGFGMDKSCYMLLIALCTNGPQRSSDLADAVHSDPSTVSRQVAQMVKDGYIERRADQEDGRAIVLAATEAGVELLEMHRRRRNESIARMVGHWSEGDRRQFAELFERFVGDYENYLPTLMSEIAEYARSGGEK